MTTLLLESLLLSLGINIAMFLVAYRQKSDKLTDISYALSFAVLAVAAFYQSDHSPYHAVLLAAILAWAVRIGGFLLYRVIKSGKDRRFDGIRENFRKFGTFWIGQAVTVWALLIPSLLAFRAQDNSSLQLVIAGCIIWFIGFLIESIADLQKYRFSQNPANKGKWIESGIWRYSRHPNYFGEILVWMGLYAVTLSTLSTPQALFGLISPITIIVLLLFVSGIPPLERAANKRWGNITAYKIYKRHTSLLIPLPKLSRKI
jgi:steroid 5-alpha reductase family enzyme